ncbi:Hypothetical protein CINCED_3A014696 [Cinara cedri]|uniref:CRAL-TRIO domain-containing protein n=1 Tax=Cinara cedri TaxID=506608 RepID=A0A5E4N713_9HEMI|nr:Hypothetical protein CINCED_3A014696 [Cinara cedri]
MVLDTELNETQMEFVTKQKYYRTDEQLDEDVTMLLEWMSKQPHLPEIKGKKWLSHFIIGCKYNLHRAKQTIDAYFVTRATHPEFICSFDRERSLYYMKVGKVCLLPKLTPEAYRVLFNKSYLMVEEIELDFLFYFQTILANVDIQMREEPMRGNIILLDLEYFPISQFVNLSPTLLKNAMDLCVNSFPVSVKGIHFINSPPSIGNLVTFIKMFLPKKIKKRIYIHNSLETLYQFIPKDVLPDQYGGTVGDYEEITNRWFEFGMANNEWLGNRPKADLSKWVGQPKIGELGVEGTFKKLEID